MTPPGICQTLSLAGFKGLPELQPDHDVVGGVQPLRPQPHHQLLQLPLPCSHHLGIKMQEYKKHTGPLAPAITSAIRMASSTFSSVLVIISSLCE